ncbi:uncharacterized protein LOC132544661 [Ylistrum balloti]|uniref:uncharacterized protein LOC132544661 n=1 Tax=Ylistrum balloti TaxID=509963 RepID=UPI002905D210|nr:uncharacterized protein LOC132544661 [Ylistrum balloti]
MNYAATRQHFIQPMKNDTVSINMALRRFRIVILSSILVVVCGSFGYGGSSGYGGNSGKGGYYSGYGGKGSYSGYGGNVGYKGYGGKGGNGKGTQITYNSQTILPSSGASLPDFTLQGRDTDSPYGSGIGLLAAIGAFAFLFALTRN